MSQKKRKQPRTGTASGKKQVEPTRAKSAGSAGKPSGPDTDKRGKNRIPDSNRRPVIPMAIVVVVLIVTGGLIGSSLLNRKSDSDSGAASAQSGGSDAPGSQSPIPALTNRAEAATARTGDGGSSSDAVQTESATSAGTTAVPFPEFADRTFSEEMVPDLINEATEYLQKREIEKALYIFEKAAAFDADFEDLYFNYAIALNFTGQTEKAVEMYEKALDIWPEYTEALNNLANIHVKQQQYDMAIEMYQKAIEYFPGPYPKGHNNLGKAFASKGDVGRAVPEFTRAIELDPDYLEARINLGTALFEQKRFSEAAQEFQIALRIDPRNRIAAQRLQSLRPFLQSQ